MKKIVLLLTLAFLLGNTHSVKAQCYGVVTLDTFAIAGSSGFPLVGNTTFNIVTANANELIMISYNGWNGPGSGPVTVDGNSATYINDATNGNSGSADVYAYSAPTAGTHTIVCSPAGYNGGYYDNFAAAFYCAGGVSPLTIASLTSNINTIVCTTGGTITDNISTTKPNSVIYCSAEINEGQTSVYPISWTGATFLGSTHTENGIDAGQAYAPECAAGSYSITATNTSPPNNGCGGLTIVLVVIPPTLALHCFSASYTQVNPACGLSNGSITVTPIGGNPPYTYNWSPNVSTVDSATGLSGGTYTIIVSDGACQDTTLIVTLPANSLKLVDTLQVNENCFGDCNGSAEIVTSGGHSPYNYSWAPSGGNAATANNLCAGNYTVTVNDNNGCSNTIVVDITQPTVLAATPTVTNALCFGGTGSAKANASGGTPPYLYGWNNAQTTATATGLSAGTYTIGVVDSRGCTTSSTATITQPSQLDVSLSGPAIICLNNQGTLTANASGGTSPYNYTWSNGVAGNGSTGTIQAATQTDTVKVTDANGCTATAQITVNLGPTMNLSITGPSSICDGLSTTLCANVQGGTGGNTYAWSPVTAITPCVAVSPTVTTTYSLNVFDNCGTEASATFTLRVNPLPATAFTASLTQGCAPLCIQFYNTTTLAQGRATNYLWTFGDGDSSKISSPSHCFPNSGLYDIGLTVTSDSGCSSTLKKTDLVKVFTKPSGAFTYSPSPVSIIDPTVQFTNMSTDKNRIIYWAWSFGDATDSLSNSENPTHTYQDTGSYCVNMVVMDINSCRDTITNCLIVEPAFTLYIPSAFTPNGDDLNPTFEPKGAYIKNFEMYIFDRWGMQLYHTTDIAQGWNGSVSGGSMAQEDTYIYKIIVTDSENNQHTYVGKVTLLR